MTKIKIRAVSVICACVLVLASVFVLSADDLPTTTEAIGFSGSLQTVRQEPDGKAVSESLNVTDTLVCENSRLALYLDTEEFILKVLDKQGNYVWSSGAVQSEAESMTGTWKRFSRAFLTIDYFNQTGAILRSSARFSASDSDLKLVENGIEATLKFQEPNATARVYITLTENGFSVRVPDDEIVFNKEGNRLAKLYVLPFFGSVYSDTVPGYFVIPDGCGALMRFEKPKTYNSSTLLRVYGKDESVTQTATYQSGAAPTEVKQLNLPLYGAVHGSEQNAFMGVITCGEAYSGFEISPAGVKIDFHWMSPVFIYREQYRQSTGTSVGYDVIQKEQNEVNPEITYTLLSDEDADYVGMAKTYRLMLSSQDALPEETASADNIPLMITALMADQSKTLFGNSTKVLTTLDDLTSWNTAFKDEGIERLYLSLYGFEKGGYSGSRIGSYSIDRRVGTEKGLKTLSKTLNNQGSALLLTKELSRAYEDQSNNSRFLYAINRVFTSTSDGGRLFGTRYYLDVPTVAKQLEAVLELPDYKKNLALSSLGNTLYSNYKEDKETTRDDMRNAVTEGLAEIKKSGGVTALENPAAYALGLTDIIYNTDMEHSRYIFETDTVPFMQIVTSGSITSFSPYLNMNAGNDRLVLQMIDYNIYPAYMLTEAESHELAKCNIQYLYSSCFNDYLPEIVRVYNQVNSVLSEVTGATVSDRSCPQDGISVTEYTNGKTIIVNYTESEATVGGVTVPAKQAVCK